MGSWPPRLGAPGEGWEQPEVGLGGGVSAGALGSALSRVCRQALAAAPCPPALQLLLKDPAPLVRMKAAETLGRLVKFA